jgi:uncharacterized protein YjbI with pentapeptide repeats
MYSTNEIEDMAKNIQNLFFIYLSVFSFCIITILAISDRQLILTELNIVLPLLNVGVPLNFFFIFGPILCILSFLYFIMNYMGFRGKLELWISEIKEETNEDRKGEDRKKEILETCDKYFLITPIARICDLYEDKRKMIILKKMIIIIFIWWLLPIVLFLFTMKYIKTHEFYGYGALSFLTLLSIWIGSYNYLGLKFRIKKNPEAAIQEINQNNTYQKTKFVIIIFLSIILAIRFVIIGINASEGNRDYFFFINGLFSNYVDLSYIKFTKDEDPTIKYWGKYENLQLQGANLEGANLSKLILRNGNFKKTNFSNAKLNESDLSGSDCEGAVFKRTVLKNVIFFNENLKKLHSNLNLADFSESNITNCDVQSCNIMMANFSQSLIIKTNFNKSNLNGSDFSEKIKNTKIFDSNFNGSQCIGCSFKKSEIVLTTFNYAIMDYSDFMLSSIDNSFFTNTSIKYLNLWSATIDGNPSFVRSYLMDNSSDRNTNLTKTDKTNFNYCTNLYIFFDNYFANNKIYNSIENQIQKKLSYKENTDDKWWYDRLYELLKDPILNNQKNNDFFAIVKKYGISEHYKPAYINDNKLFKDKEQYDRCINKIKSLIESYKIRLREVKEDE